MNKNYSIKSRKPASRKSRKPASRKSRKLSSRKSRKPASRKSRKPVKNDLYELKNCKKTVRYDDIKDKFEIVLKNILKQEIVYKIYKNHEILDMNKKEYEDLKNTIFNCSIDLIKFTINKICNGVLNIFMFETILLASLIISLKLIGSHDLDLSRNMENDLVGICKYEKYCNIDKLDEIIIDILRKTDWKGCESLYL